MSFVYPKVKRDESIVDNYFGTEVKDPYRWLEDPESAETKQFVADQNKISYPYIESCEYRDQIHSRLKELNDYPKYGCPSKHGTRYFYSMNSGLQNQSVIYVQETLEAEPTVFFNPNELSEDGTIAIRTKAFSETGKYFSYGLSESGSDWFNIQFMDVETRTVLPDIIKKAKFCSIEWTHDDKGVFYSRYPESDINKDGTETQKNENKMLYYHRLGTSQEDDVMCIQFPEHPKWSPYSTVSDCGNYLVTSVHEGTSKTVSLYVTDLNALENGICENLPMIPIFEDQEEDSDYDYITNFDSILTFRTNSKASNYKLINIDIKNPQRENWKTLIPEHANDVLQWSMCVNDDILVICYLKDVKDIIQLWKFSTGEFMYTFPLEIGSIRGFSGKKTNSEIFYLFTSFTSPGVIYQCDVSLPTPVPKIFREIKLSNYDSSKFQASQVFYDSKDGTKIPMYLIHSKEMKMDGSNPCILYGYGGFNISITPGFSVNRLLFLDNMNGVYAIANIRGGGEYGKKWHNSGRLLNKQNVFDDFIGAAEYLIKNDYTSSQRLAIQGGSNGGLLVGACVNQRPEIFGCAIAHVGVMDMLRFHKFTIGHAWCSDFGCADEEKFFKYLHSYSPLHNIKVPSGENIQYPSYLLLTADHDDRVVPLHSLKFIAEAQNILSSSSKQKNPILIRVDTKAGHGAGKPTSKIIEESTDIYCFIIKALALKFQN